MSFKKKLVRGSLAVLSLLAGLAVLLVALVFLRADRTFDAPEPALRASKDPAIIERGRYLVFGPAHCAACHGPPDKVTAGTVEGTPPLAGGFSYPSPIGVLHFPNITPDPETGIGRSPTDSWLACCDMVSSRTARPSCRSWSTRTSAMRI
jgi:hypothetical protein